MRVNTLTFMENGTMIEVSTLTYDELTKANTTVLKQILRLKRKSPKILSSTKLNCCVQEAIYNRVYWEDGMLKWGSSASPIVLTYYDEFLNLHELNKLLVYTYRAMCEAANPDLLNDSPEDLLEFAEEKLKKLLKEVG